MDYKNTLEAIIGNVEEIRTLISGFAANKKIRAIEMELTLEKVRNLYDILLMLKETYSVENAGPSAQVAGDAGNADVDDDSPSTENKEEATLDLSEEQQAENDDDIKIVSDRFKRHTTSIHDSLSKSQQYNELSEKLKSKAITDIGNAIGINDKFIFVKELFHGDTNMYNNTIGVLNNATNFNEAYNYLIGNFDWDMDSPLVQILLDLIRRKLIINKNE
jgi:hypothetical protein